MEKITQPPVKVSPLIRGARWTFLIAGILYGSARLSRLSRKERIRLEELEKTRPEREAKMKAEKEIKAKMEMDALIKEIGSPLT